MIQINMAEVLEGSLSSSCKSPQSSMILQSHRLQPASADMDAVHLIGYQPASAEMEAVHFTCCKQI